MTFLQDLLFGASMQWGGGVAHSILVLGLAIAFGTMLGKIKVAGISLGVTGILFVGIALSHFGININEHLMHFMKEFGLILFVYSVGLQVGPGFFSSFKEGGLKLNQIAILVVLFGVITTIALYYITGLPITTMVGVMSGAVTNTPGLGAAQSAYRDIAGGIDAADIATGYAVAYPLGVIGAILTLLILRYVMKINKQQEEAAITGNEDKNNLMQRISIEITNPSIDGKTIGELRQLLVREFVVSRICAKNGEPKLVKADTTLHLSDKILLLTRSTCANLQRSG